MGDKVIKDLLGEIQSRSKQVMEYLEDKDGEYKGETELMKGTRVHSSLPSDRVAN